MDYDDDDFESWFFSGGFEVMEAEERRKKAEADDDNKKIERDRQSDYDAVHNALDHLGNKYGQDKGRDDDER